ncbi:MAG: glycoside hydrolase family 15 protein [Oligoflexia bacterium]|nr:glycoside hydrolase family 15 protein [Oligoflexia bacterium]
MRQLDLAIIGNCQVSALLDSKGAFVWSCMPRMDSQAIFASLLGAEEHGIWSCLPEARDYEVKQRYLRNSNVLQTEFHLKSGERFDLIDFAPRFADKDSHYRAPQFIRIIRAVRGNPRVRMVLKPVMDYGRLAPETSMTGEGIVFRGNGTRIFFHTDIPASYVIQGEPFELAGDYYCVLSHGEPFHRPLKFGCEEFFERTLSYWRTWVKHCSIPFEYQDAVIRSALALKLHIFEDTGAIIAATTTSLPESLEDGRTWDYRYCWLRDAYFVINALNQLGHFEEMERFIQFLHNIAVTEPGGRLQPVYGIGGERVLEERELPWLPGFKGAGPVRVGNAAYLQPQFDVYGEMVLAVTPLFFDQRLDRIDLNRAFENVVKLVDKAIACFAETDSGIWEFRTERKHYLFSKLMCWAAVDRGIKIAEKLGKSAAFPGWLETREKMRSVVESRGWNPALGFYTQALDGEHADASNLLMHAVNFHSPDSERFRGMVEKYERLLMRNGMVFRYLNADDFGTPKHAFTICSFWMIDALAAIGRVADAKVLFERVLASANHVGLLSEDIDPVSGELWGNFPQVYSHVGVINSAFRLSKSWSEAF